MWLSHTDSEVNRFHPVCEKALKAALIKLSRDSVYRVVHHEYIGALEMDFVIQNIKTGRYLCVIEVKRTPADVHSARSQSQAMSYVSESTGNLEKPFYILTNLEYAFAFRYDPARPRVIQQMLYPGLRHIGDFDMLEQAEFEARLSDNFADMLDSFLTDSYNYLVTLEQFENHMKNLINNPAKWRSSLVVLLYEYIRGAFLSIGRKDLPYDVRFFRNNVERICTEATTVNFKEIFTFSPDSHEKRVSISNDILSNIFDFGKQNISGDSVAGLLHSIVSAGLEHDGVVPTDLELARIVSVLAKSITGDIGDDEYICDPAAGSGNLISSAIEVYNIPPRQIKANDINERLLELLSLRIGLNFAKIVNRQNAAEISAENIVRLPLSYFEKVPVIVMNPPFVAGISCTERKNELFKRIRELTHREAVSNVGQMGLEGVFLEAICTLSGPGTVIACVFPKVHLIARGKEAVVLRKYLLNNFGLNIIFSYPEEGLFADVDKGTCVIVGRNGIPSDVIKIISSNELVADIDLQMFERAIANDLDTLDFIPISSGIEGMTQTKTQLASIINDGWRIVCREYKDSQLFLNTHIRPNKKLRLLSDIEKKELKRVRGYAGNSGASDLLQMKRDKPLCKKYSGLPVIASVRKAVLDELFISDGDTICFDATQISDTEILSIVNDYLQIPIKTGRQQRKEKTLEELVVILNKTSRKLTPVNSVLIPRLIRVKGKVYITTKQTVVSTNFYTLNLGSLNEALLLSSWFGSIFYQLICETNSKPQEGPRKLEVKDIEATYIPILSELTEQQKSHIVKEGKNWDFLELNKPRPRKIDKIWAEILFGCEAEMRLAEAVRLLEFLVNARNPLDEYADDD